MPWINPLDKVPQVPVDWANHIVYGGVAGLALLGAATALDAPDPAQCATLIVFAVAAAKKLVDFVKEGESPSVCIGKALITAAWPFSVWVLG